MTPKKCAWAAVDAVVGLCAENGLKYRRGDFEVVEETVDVISETEAGWVRGRNLVAFSLVGITVSLAFDFARAKRRLKERRECFSKYDCCTIGSKGVYFSFPLGHTSGKDFVLKGRISE